MLYVKLRVTIYNRHCYNYDWYYNYFYCCAYHQHGYRWWKLFLFSCATREMQQNEMRTSVVALFLVINNNVPSGLGLMTLFFVLSMILFHCKYADFFHSGSLHLMNISLDKKKAAIPLLFVYSWIISIEIQMLLYII